MNEEHVPGGHDETGRPRIEPGLVTPPATPAPESAPAAAAPAATMSTAPGAAPVVVRRGRPFWQWWLIASLFVSAIAIVCLVTALGHLGDVPMHVVVDGEEVGGGVNIALGSLPAAHQVALVSALVLAVVVMLLVVPLVIVIVLGAVVVAVVAGVGLPLIAVAAAFLVATSPIWVVGLLVWMVVRANRRAAAAARAAQAAGSATVGA